MLRQQKLCVVTWVGLMASDIYGRLFISQRIGIDLQATAMVAFVAMPSGVGAAGPLDYERFISGLRPVQRVAPHALGQGGFKHRFAQVCR